MKDIANIYLEPLPANQAVGKVCALSALCALSPGIRRFGVLYLRPQGCGASSAVRGFVINQTEQLFQREVDALEMAGRERLGFDGKLLPEVSTWSESVGKELFRPRYAWANLGAPVQKLWKEISLWRCFMAASVGMRKRRREVSPEHYNMKLSQFLFE
jgi:hypothetical protein